TRQHRFTGPDTTDQVVTEHGGFVFTRPAAQASKEVRNGLSPGTSQAPQDAAVRSGLGDRRSSHAASGQAIARERDRRSRGDAKVGSMARRPGGDPVQV